MNLEEVRNVYDKWAPFYNPTHSWSLPKRRLARQLLKVQHGDHVLDLACGTGANLSDLHGLVGESGRVVGVDLSPRMLERARHLISKNAWKNVEVLEADAAHLPFESNIFDKVICTYALNIIPDYLRTVEEIYHVMVPGGRFVSLEVRSGHSMPTWLAPICAVDLSHETLAAIKKVFREVQVQYYWKGMVFIAIAEKP